MDIPFRHMALVLAASVSLAGCSLFWIDSRDTTLEYYPPKDSDRQVRYLETIARPYEVIGTVMVSVEKACPFKEVTARMRHEAAMLGGDAITGVHRESEGLIRDRYTAKVVVLK